MKRSAEEEKNWTEKSNDKEGVITILERVLSQCVKGDKKKKQSRPKIRYLCIRINNWRLEIGTSSYTGVSLREKGAPSMLNSLFFGKLPDVLQSSTGQKYLILTINPIVDLYEECKNTLSANLCKKM
jgi:hypothetical protein